MPEDIVTPSPATTPKQQYEEAVDEYQPEPPSQKLADALIKAKPSWQTDGRGVQGPPKDLMSVERRFGDSFLHRQQFPDGKVGREPRQPFFPETPSSTEDTVAGTNVDVYGSVNGAPAVFHLLESAVPTVPPPVV